MTELLKRKLSVFETLATPEMASFQDSSFDLHLLLSSQEIGTEYGDMLVVNKDYIDMERLITQDNRVEKLSKKAGRLPTVQKPFTRLKGQFKLVLEALAFYQQHASTYVGRKLSPTMEVFNRLAVDLFATETFNPSFVLGGTEPLPAEKLQTFLANFCAEIRSPQHRKALAKFERASVKNTRSAQHYVVRLFERYSRLLVVRVDLSYGEDAKRTVTAQQAFADRKRFFRNAKANRLFQHLVGYVWKLEFGNEKRYHYHIFIFFDGSQVRQDVTLAGLIGEYWKHQITEGRGCYFNCNARKERYTELGIGMVAWNDSRMQQGLLHGVRYLTKVDEWIRLALPENGRSFGKGELPPLPDTPRGRPRQPVNSNLTF